MDSDERQQTPKEAIKRATVTQVYEWVKLSSVNVNEETTVKSFKKCSFSSAHDGSEDHFLYENSEDENSHSDKEFLEFYNRED
jgi:hypothetical protein